MPTPASSGVSSALTMALSIAHEAHHGQTRRHGAPYIAHPVAVARLVEDLADAMELALDDKARERAHAIALLHDVVEDSEDITVAELAARFGDDVGSAVELLTKRGKGPEATRAYYERLGREASDVVRLVKACDRVHNLSELHLAPDADKLAKYVAETLEHVVPLAHTARDRAVGAGLALALHDAIRAACRAQGAAVPEPTRAALDGGRVGDARVPLGLYAIVEGPARLQDLVEGGVAMVQLRNKRATDRELLALVDAMLPLCARAGVPLVVNDRADVAVTARRAHGTHGSLLGVHVGQGDLPPRAVRRIVGDDALVGASSHTDPELHAIVDEARDLHSGGGADHVAVGPVYASPTKEGHAPVVGVAALAHRCAMSRLPVVAIGGITSPMRAAEVARAGAQLTAAVSALDVAEARVVARRMSASFMAARAATRTRADRGET